MANVRRLSDNEVELLIDMWQNEPSLWNTMSSLYSDADVRKAALVRISEQLDGLDIGTFLQALQYVVSTVHTRPLLCINNR